MMKARTMKRTPLLSLLLCGWLISSQLPAADPKRDNTDPDYSAELPRIAPTSPEESLKESGLSCRDRRRRAVDSVSDVDGLRRVWPRVRR